MLKTPLPISEAFCCTYLVYRRSFGYAQDDVNYSQDDVNYSQDDVNYSQHHIHSVAIAAHLMPI